MIPAMPQADRIRKFVLDHYVEPARIEGRAEITLRAGDIHRAMRLTNRLPVVCNAIGYPKFLELARVTLVDRDGPVQGANVYFRFSLGGPRSPISPRVVPLKLLPRPVERRSGGAVDLRDAVVLISCVKSKRPIPAPARLLYTSAWFVGVRKLVEASGAPWFLLSSRYGLVAPTATIATYDYTLNSLGVAERRAWAEKVLAKLLPELGARRRVVIFAGLRYREFLVEPLHRHGCTVEVPMEGLRRGEQLAWLSAHG